MPCYDSRDTDDRQDADTQRNMLCFLCTDLEKRNIGLPYPVSEWWEIHKSRDAYRKNFEKLWKTQPEHIWKEALAAKDRADAREHKFLQNARKILGLK